MSTMLSTDGIMDISSGHSSTKIHHAPGGKTSIDLFGGYDKAEPAAAAAAVVVQAPATPGRDASSVLDAAAVAAVTTPSVSKRTDSRLAFRELKLRVMETVANCKNIGGLPPAPCGCVCVCVDDVCLSLVLCGVWGRGARVCMVCVGLGRGGGLIWLGG